MILPSVAASVTEALVRAGQHEASRHPWETGPGERKLAKAFTIALSREVGARGTSVARAVGAKLNWPVYDHELLDRIAHDANVPVDLLKYVDERPNSWLQDCIEGFAGKPPVTEAGFVHRLRLVLGALGAEGACIIVGRGAPHFLPGETTLRVRLFAERDDRTRVIARELGLSVAAAARRVDEMERARVRFIQEHFARDPTDPQNYDVVLNTSRFTVEDCADLVIESLRRMERLRG